MNSRSPASATQTVATFFTPLQFEDIPEAVRESAKLRILDIFGICIAAGQKQEGAGLVETLAEWGNQGGTSSWIGTGEKVPPTVSALVDGTRAHGLDFDDTHHASRTHPSCVIIPAAWATAQAVHASGRDFLCGTVVGLEVLVRVGLVAPGRFHERGLHATSLCGPIGAAATASRLLGCDVGTTTQALGIAASMGSGLREAYLGGDATDTKSLHAGLAAQGGVLAAGLARRGFTGPITALEGRFGFYNAYVSPDPWKIENLSASLGDKWHTPEIVFKLYPCGSLIHASIDAALHLREITGLNPDEIATVSVVVPAGMVSTVCEPRDQKILPRSGYQAKFSAQYAVAAALLFGEVNAGTYEDRMLSETRLRNLLRRTDYEVDHAMPFPDKYPGGVVVRMQDGAEYRESMVNSIGSPERPAGREQLLKKFRSNVVPVLGSERADHLADVILRIEHEANLEKIVDLCRAGAP